MIRKSAFVSLVVASLIPMVGCGDDTAPDPNLPSPNNDNNDNNVNNNRDNNAPNNGCDDPVDEVCDEIDNDCDGDIDEGFGLEANVAHCGRCDNACAFDNGRAACEEGQCALVGCLPGFFDEDGDPDNGCESEECVPDEGGEVCDEADNDCDGEFDEGFEVGSDVEHCLGCFEACELTNATPACDEGACVIDACDDGFVDEDEDPDNGCEAVACVPDEGGEVCDEADNDCDGDVDEGFELDTDVAHCGRCDNVCAFDNALPACVEGDCVLEACEADYFDLNEDDEDGCEYLCEADQRSDEELPCDGQDNDCNGLIDDDTGEGNDCVLGEGVDGTLACLDGALICSAEPTEGTEICGDLAGLLAIEGSPYVIVCEEVRVPLMAQLVVDEGVELLSGLPEGQHPTLRVQGQLQGRGGSWRGIEVVVEGQASLVGERMEATSPAQTLIVVPDASVGRLSAAQTTMVGTGPGAVGLSVEGGPMPEGAVSWQSGSFEGLSIGVAVSAEGPLSIEGARFSEVITAVALSAEASLALSGVSLINTEGPAAQGISLSPQLQIASVALEEVGLDQRDEDAALSLDADQLDLVSGDAQHEGEGRSTVHLRGDVDGPRVSVTPFGSLDAFTFLGPAQVLEDAVLEVAPEATLRGASGGRLSVEGQVVLDGAAAVDLPMDVAEGGAVSADDARVGATAASGLAGCLLSAPGVQISAERAEIRADLIEDLDGLCLQAPSTLSGINGAVIAGFERGLVIEAGPNGTTISDLTLEDNAVGVFYQGEQAPTIERNTFLSLTDRQVIAIHMITGSEPGGRISANTFDMDSGDSAYHLDPDNLSEGVGTVFGPNDWLRHQPDGFLISGQLTSAQASLHSVTEQPPEDDFFVSVQVLGTMTIAEGSRFEANPQGQIFTFQGLSVGDEQVLIEVEGELILDGPGVILNNLPVSFRPGSEGEVEQCELSGLRTDLPLILIEDAAPTIGGVGTVNANILTGSNRQDVVGIEIRAEAPMCVAPENLCPFIASNDFRNLGVGVVLFSPADFSGVNDFDDANPNGDTVPVNVERR